MSGSVEALIARKVGGRFSVRETTVNVIGLPTEILRGDPERAGWLISNTGGNDANIAWTRPVTAPDAIPIAANGGGMSVNVEEDFVLPIFPLYGTAGGAGTTIRVIEVIRVSAALEGGGS